MQRFMNVPSLNLEIDGHGLTAPRDLHVETLGSSELGVCLEGLLGTRHLEPVDGFETIAVLQAELAEKSIRANSEEPNADDLSVLLLRHDARLAHEIRLVLENVVDHRAVDVELRVADLLDLVRDVFRNAAARRRRGLRRIGCGWRRRRSRRSEQQDLAKRRSAGEPNGWTVLRRIESDVRDLFVAHAVPHATHFSELLARRLKHRNGPRRVRR